jgi:hypothetical protein
MGNVFLCILIAMIQRVDGKINGSVMSPFNWTWQSTCREVQIPSPSLHKSEPAVTVNETLRLSSCRMTWILITNISFYQYI